MLLGIIIWFTTPDLSGLFHIRSVPSRLGKALQCGLQYMDNVAGCEQGTEAKQSHW